MVPVVASGHHAAAVLLRLGAHPGAVEGIMAFELRDYQSATIAAVRAACAQGSRRICVVLPTGAGKTVIMSEIIRRAVAKGSRCLFLAHRAELVDQAVGALAQQGLTVGAISASAASAPQPHAPVQVATVQTLLARNERPQAGIIVADESHHYTAAEFRRVIDDYPGAYVIGPTATPERGDGRGLGEMFQRIVIGVRVRELVAAGYLVPAVLIAPKDKLRAGQIAQRPVDAYQQHAAGRLALCFSPSVALAEEHAEEFRCAGIPSALVTGTTPDDERRAAFAALRAGSIRVLCNVYVATEGFDIPAVDCVILARGIGSAGGYLQMVGRALRPAPGKSDALILDLQGTSHQHGHPEDDRQYSLEGRGIRNAESTEEVDQSYCRVCGAPIRAGETCPECGTAPREEAGLSITGERLVRYESKRREGPDQRAATLRRWIVDAAARGFKPGWAAWKFNAVYGTWPSREIREAAMRGVAA